MTYQNQNQNNGTLEWDDVITEDVKEFILLEPGEYDFVVTDFAREWYDGSNNLPPCNKAVVTVKIETDEGVAYVKSNLFLTKKTEGLLAQFFASIGMKKKGEPLRMDWSKVTGKTGRCRIDHRTYNGEKYNDLKRFLPPADYGKESSTASEPKWKKGGY